MSTSEQVGVGARVLSEDEAAAVRRGVPDPGIALPAVAWPTVALFVVALAAWVGATAVALSAGPWWWPATVPVHAAVTFLMFTVLHESAHHAAGRLGWVNAVLGRASVPFVAAWTTFPVFRYLHVEHHRHTNEDVLSDPDAWVEGGPAWQRPLRWLAIDAWYVRFYVSRVRVRPRGELAGELATLLAVVAGAALAVGTGHGLELVVVYLLPQRLGLGVLAWWFDWLPHHDLGVTGREDRFRATRVRVGREWYMTPVMLYQNYHLVHHIHPTIPFYRYVAAWEGTREDYLARDVPIATAWGTELTPAEYRAWRGLTDGWTPTSADVASSTGAQRFHRLRVAEVTRVADDAVAVTFTVPDELVGTFAHRAGQHVTLRGRVAGRTVRRTYSVCSAAGSGVLRVGVRLVPGGRFSALVGSLAVGDTLEVAPPTGRFLPEGRHDGRRLAAVAAGSGVTPVLSVAASVLADEPATRMTLVLANRDAGSTMFAAELGMLVSRFEGRLQVVHVRSREAVAPSTVPRAAVPPAALGVDAAARHERVLAGRVDARLLRTVVPDDVDAWFVCGPDALVEVVRAELDGRGVPAEQVHVEAFTSTDPVLGEATGEAGAAVRVTLDGATHELTADGDEPLLETALRAGLDAPYSCAGGGCGTCVATLRRGTVHMALHHALTGDDVAAGRVLTCQARPTSGAVELEY